MAILTAFFFYLLAALLAGALLAYPLQLYISAFAGVPPDKLATRTALLLALLCFPWITRRFHVWSRADLGYGPAGQYLLAAVGKGLFFGAATLGVLSAALLIAGIRFPDPELPQLLSDLPLIVLGAALSGLLVAVIEETFFRGAFYTALLRRRGTAASIVASSLLYSVVHFMAPAPLSSEPDPSWPTGLIQLAQGLRQAFDAVNCDSMLALFAVGVFLALLRQRTGHIGYCIGVHAGWVMAIRLTKEFTNRDYQSQWAFLVGTYDGIIGYLAAAWIAAIALGLYFWTPAVTADDVVQTGGYSQHNDR